MSAIAFVWQPLLLLPFTFYLLPVAFVDLLVCSVCCLAVGLRSGLSATRCNFLSNMQHFREIARLGTTLATSLAQAKKSADQAEKITINFYKCKIQHLQVIQSDPTPD